MICCRKNHATPPSIAKNIPKIPMACLCPAKSVTTSYLTALIILSDVLSVNRNRRCHYPTTSAISLIIQMDYTQRYILNSIADFRCRRGDHIIACNSRIMCFGSIADTLIHKAPYLPVTWILPLYPIHQILTI